MKTVSNSGIMDRSELYRQITQKKSMLCVGLDTDPEKMPAGISMYDFNRLIIDATAQYAVAYKPNLAFYEAQGIDGWKTLEETVGYIRANYPGMFIIADAKRGDIGNTAKMYAKALLGNLDFDAVTLAPYMGSDSIRPFLEYKGKWAIVLAVTSNASAAEFQYRDCGGEPLFMKVVKEMSGISSPDNMMFVTGATHVSELAEVRKAVPDNFLLVPGVGTQGGSVADVIKYGSNSMGGLLINASRSILYAGSKINDFEYAASEAAKSLVRQMGIA